MHVGIYLSGGPEDGKVTTVPEGQTTVKVVKTKMPQMIMPGDTIDGTIEIVRGSYSRTGTVQDQRSNMELEFFTWNGWDDE